MNLNNYNNIAICSAAILIILNKVEKLEISKALLIYPLIMHTDTLNFLSKKSTKPRKINSLLLSNPSFFINFNDRFKDSITLTLNSIQYLLLTEQITFNKKLAINRSIIIRKDLGKKAILIEKSSDKIVHLLDHPIEEIYLNLRIKL